ncbi:MAG: hypothetical protein ACAF41_26680 [Leptolyngbya sp. BL-A-14]
MFSTGLRLFSTGSTQESVFAASIGQLGTIGINEGKVFSLHKVV